jgi:NADH dehydrogenase
MDAAVDASAAVGSGPIVVAGAGYAGLHVALRLTAKLRNNPMVELTLVDRHDYHQVITELPRVASGTRAADAVRIPLQNMLATRVRFVQAEITGFDLPRRQLLTRAGPVGWRRLVLALGSRPNDFAIPGLAERTLSVYSASDAEQVWAAVGRALDAAATAADPQEQRRLATVVVGGGGATGVELAGELAEVQREVASSHGLDLGRPTVRLVEAGPTILAGSSPQLIDKATKILSDLGVQFLTNATIAAVTEEGFRLTDGQLIEGGVFVWAGGVKAPGLVADSGLPTGHNGRVKVDQYLRTLGPSADLRRRRPCLGDRSEHRARAAAPGADSAGRGRDRGPQPRRRVGRQAAGGVHLPRQGVRRLGRNPPRRRRHRGHHHRRAGGPPAQRRHRMGIPPIRQAPVRLGPSSPLAARRSSGSGAASTATQELRSARRSGGSARGYQGLPAPLAIPAAAIQTAAKSYFYASPALA